MHQEDIAQVAEIDREAFPTQWPPPNYQRELGNRLAHYVVVCDAEKTVEEPRSEVAPARGLSGAVSRVRQLFNSGRFSGQVQTPSCREYILGFAGFWIMADEAHLTNIAVRESYRRQGIGELLLISVIDLATELNTSIVTLEVRASNTPARSLYGKYGFAQVGIRRGYYLSDREDGVLMSTESIASDSFQKYFRKLRQAHTRKLGTALQQVGRYSPTK
jgi:ribosomal-protein-alanine N-acetyltransferase